MESRRWDLERKFWRLNDEHEFGTPVIALYFYLVKVNNECMWAKTFKRNSVKIKLDLKISYEVLKRARNILKEHGFIDFISVSGNANTTYWFTIDLSSEVYHTNKETAKIKNE